MPYRDRETAKAAWRKYHAVYDRIPVVRMRRQAKENLRRAAARHGMTVAQLKEIVS